MTPTYTRAREAHLKNAILRSCPPTYTRAREALQDEIYARPVKRGTPCFTEYRQCLTIRAPREAPQEDRQNYRNGI